MSDKQYKIGDRFVIEIDDILYSTVHQIDDTTSYIKEQYKIKGFNTLTFDAQGLDKLERYTPTSDAFKEGYEEGYREGYMKGMDEGVENLKAFHKYIEENSLQPNDIVQINFPTGSIKAVVTKAYDDIMAYYSIDDSTVNELDLCKYGDIVQKTGLKLQDLVK